MTTKIKYVNGDALEPISDGPKLICHVCNDLGKFGKGFALSVARKWPHVRNEFQAWAKSAKVCDVSTYTCYGDFYLGRVQFVEVADSSGHLYVANMVAQRGLISPSNPQPVSYDFLGACLSAVAMRALAFDESIHCPRIGCGLAGGSWVSVERLIKAKLCRRHIPVTVYDLE